MNTSVGYLFQRLFYRIKEFLRHWYVKSAKLYWHFVITQVERLDYVLAWRITLRNLFKPLYKDYSMLGYILGFFFRMMRLVFSTAVYALIFASALCIYIAWILVPPALLYGALTNQPIG